MPVTKTGKAGEWIEAELVESPPRGARQRQIGANWGAWGGTSTGLLTRLWPIS